MKRIVEMVPARPGWYARWQLSSGATRAYPVMLWAVIEETDGANRGVIGMDSLGQWPGGDDNEAGVDFVRYVYQPLDGGQPDDAANPLEMPDEIPTATSLRPPVPG
jgi:hypothetical protein